MEVFKFGGASVKDANSVRNVVKILKDFAPKKQLIIVISAMGKTSNHLENILQKVWNEEAFEKDLIALKNFHQNIVRELFQADKKEIIFEQIEDLLNHLEKGLNQVVKYPIFDEVYDQIISYGELLSSIIVGNFVVKEGLSCQWIDARELILTNEDWREAKVNWQLSQEKIKSILPELLEKGLIITQGFIGRNLQSKKTTTLGREGSDFSAAIFAYCLDAHRVTIWKDVAGFLNADPKKIQETQLYEELSYKETAEMSRYGASVIHPKTIAPLAQKNIPLFVKSFLNPEEKGTRIYQNIKASLLPAVIFKDKQVLISLESKDLKFIDAAYLDKIMQTCDRHHIPVNLLQRFAMNCSVVTNNRPSKIENLCKDLSQEFEINLYENLELLTLKHYQKSLIEKFTEGKDILLIQENRNIFQAVLR